MASTIKVDKIEGSTGSTITVPTGQTLTLTDGLSVSSLPTVTVAKGGTNLTSFAAGDVLYATGATTLAKLAKGTTLQTLKMNAGATAPEWATVAAAAGGAWELISTLTASSSASLDFTTFSTDYKDFKLIGSGITCATNQVFPRIRYRVASAFVTASDYDWGYTGYDIVNTGIHYKGYVNQSSHQLVTPYNGAGVGNTAGYNLNLEYLISDVHSTSLWKMNNYSMNIIQGGLGTSEGVMQSVTGGCSLTQTSAVTGIQFYFSSGNIALGTLSLYGRKIS